MRGGTLRHLVTIQQTTESRSSSGAVVNSWGTFAQVWAAIEPLTGREYLASAQTQTEVTHKIIIRYLSGVTAKMQVIYDSRTFDIEAVMNDRERDRMMTLMAVERSE